MPQNNIIERIVLKSQDSLTWIISSGRAQTLQDVISIAHSTSNYYDTPIIPYFANRDFVLESPFADYYSRRLLRRNFISANPFRLTARGRKMLQINGPSSVPVNGNLNIFLPYSVLPPTQLILGSRTARIKPLIDESALILTSLLPPDPAFFYVFSHYHKDAMRTSYPLIRDGDTYLGVDTSDVVRNVAAFPEPSILHDCHESYVHYLQRYVVDFQKYVEMVFYMLLSIGNVHFIHLCNSQLRTLNQMNDRIHLMLDFVPSCDLCNMTPNRHTNLVNVRHNIGRSWEKGILSELFFSKLVAQVASQIDPSIEVYPRLIIDGLKHESDTLVKKGNHVILFELKRSTAYDTWCSEGVNQLAENKTIIEKWGVTCSTILVTNMNAENLPDNVEVDVHLKPADLPNLRSIIGSLL